MGHLRGRDGQVWIVTAESCWHNYRYGILLFERGKPQFSLLRSPREGRKDMCVLQTLLTQAPVVVSEHLEGGNRRDKKHLSIPCHHHTELRC